MIQNEIESLLKKEEQLCADKNLRAQTGLPEQCYFLSDDTILCYPRLSGDSRYPYAADGFTLWAHSSGYLSLNESTFYYILPSDEGKEPYCAFFGGLPEGDGFIPISITGVAKNARERDVYRFTVYTPQAVYYIAKTPEIVFFMRAFVSPQKQAIFTVGALNVGKTEQKTYLSSFFNCLLMHQAGENVETKWFKECRVTPHGFRFESVEDLDRTTHLENFGVINRIVHGNVLYAERTCSRADYVGGKTTSLHNATPLYTGHFTKQAPVCKFGDTAVAGDLYSLVLQVGECATIDYVAEAYFDRKETDCAIRAISADFADRLVTDAKLADEKKHSDPAMLKMVFADFADSKLQGETFTKFAGQVQRQVEFAALAKNSGVSMLGVRDVAQQLEAALMWNPTACRKKFVELFGFLDPSGRAPRQYSIPAEGAIPQMDTRAFIDQGLWIISAVYTYLTFTDDYSLLDEECGYYKIIGKNRVEPYTERNSIFEHLTRIADYLLVNIDKDTHCLRALYGDWNDAVDGLGLSKDSTKEFGSGVSVMASLQLYESLSQLLQILGKYGDKFNQTARYQNAQASLKQGLLSNAIETKNGKRKILHGWGDNNSYKVGSFCDVDGKSRDSLTANAFWVIAGAYLWDKSIKKDILGSYDNLDSKYGLKTFEPFFDRDAKAVGRIVNLPKGTAENAATYVHATMFGIWSLFGMGEGKRAWQQLEKVLPLTHSLITTTPFVMSNSYSYNADLGLDGESMSDWFTGSANVFIKTLVWYVFGIKPNLNGVMICPSAYQPFRSATISLVVKGKKITLQYQKIGANSDKRIVRLNGNVVNAPMHEAMNTPAFYIPTEQLLAENLIEILD